MLKTMILIKTIMSDKTAIKLFSFLLINTIITTVKEKKDRKYIFSLYFTINYQ